jgi:hypothetical protein
MPGGDTGWFRANRAASEAGCWLSCTGGVTALGCGAGGDGRLLSSLEAGSPGGGCAAMIFAPGAGVDTS